jgi:hypothetical protein
MGLMLERRDGQRRHERAGDTKQPLPNEEADLWPSDADQKAYPNGTPEGGRP